MIVVTGASGKLGGLVVRRLLKSVPAEKIVAAVRSPEKASGLKALGVQIREGDYAKPATLASAFEGAEKLLLISSNEMGQRVAQHQAVIDAAVAAKVKLLVYTSLLKADTTSLSLAAEHLATEKAIRSSGLPFVILRNGWYLENHTEALAPALQHGVILGASGAMASLRRLDGSTMRMRLRRYLPEMGTRARLTSLLGTTGIRVRSWLRRFPLRLEVRWFTRICRRGSMRRRC